MTELERELYDQLAAEKARADKAEARLDLYQARAFKAEAACAEMRDLLMKANDVLRSVSEVVQRRGQQTNWAALAMKVNAVLLSQHRPLFMPHDVGTGWLSPEVKAKVREIVQWELDIITDSGRELVEERSVAKLKEALALLDGKQ